MGLNVVINPDYQEEIGLIIYEGGKKDYFGLEFRRFFRAFLGATMSYD